MQKIQTTSIVREIQECIRFWLGVLIFVFYKVVRFFVKILVKQKKAKTEVSDDTK